MGVTTPRMMRAWRVGRAADLDFRSSRLRSFDVCFFITHPFYNAGHKAPAKKDASKEKSGFSASVVTMRKLTQTSTFKRVLAAVCTAGLCVTLAACGSGDSRLVVKESGDDSSQSSDSSALKNMKKIAGHHRHGYTGRETEGLLQGTEDRRQQQLCRAAGRQRRHHR